MIPRGLKRNFSLTLAYVVAVLVTRQTEANPFLAGLPVIKVPQALQRVAGMGTPFCVCAEDQLLPQPLRLWPWAISVWIRCYT